tara:strand:+ start:180 stop:590 length:411 start_codon:yes stop_codon:yes gene_type:complete
MKNLITTAVTLLMTAICFGQAFTTSRNSVNYCDQIQKNINLFEKQINGLDQREYYLKTNDSVDEEQLLLIEKRRKQTIDLQAKYTLIKANNCNPNSANSSGNDSNDNVEIVVPKIKFNEPNNGQGNFEVIPVKDKD